VVFAGTAYSCMPQAPGPRASSGRGQAAEGPEPIYTIPGTSQDGSYGSVLQVQNLRCTGSEAGTGNRQEHGKTSLGREATFSVGLEGSLQGCLDPAKG